MQPLPVDEHLPRIAATVGRRRAALIVAPPGAGKTTRIPPALLDAGPLILLQPRRVAARALARRIASERGWTVGREVGWQVRGERRLSRATQLVVATEGILTARLRDDPLLESFATVVLDEFHERSLHADLALALAREAWRARDDLRLVVMSATLDAGPLADYLDDAPVIDLPGRAYPVTIEWRPAQSPARAVREALADEGGHVLVFLPGAPEIRAVERELRDAGALPGGPALLPLHGSLDADAQDAALAPSALRKVILATNLAETSLTVDGVTVVVDTGLHKVPRADPAVGLDRLEIERISSDSAEQRAGRAGRTAPGRALRLWDVRETLRPHRQAEVARVDLARPALELLAWGADPRTFDWFEAPPTAALDAALGLLERLGAVRDGRVTPVGRALLRLPLHPRLGRVLLGAGGHPLASAACAVLAEGWSPAGEAPTNACDPLARADAIARAPWAVRRLADELAAAAGRAQTGPAGTRDPDTTLRRAFLAAYPDRVARRRQPGSARLRLAGGHGAVLAPDSGVREAGWLVALDLLAGRRGPESQARVRCASAIDREWLEPTGREVVHRLDSATGAVRAVERSLYETLVLAERPLPADPDVAAPLLAAELARRGPDTATRALVARAALAGVEIDLDGLLRMACAGRVELPRVDLATLLPHDARARIDRLAPATLELPSGRSARLDYRDDGAVAAAVKLQELFGLADTPTVGLRATPVVFELLAPNGRPVQTTSDLRSFWERTYPEVRRELRGRYPKHPWPEDPWTARPTWRTKRADRGRDGGGRRGG